MQARRVLSGSCVETGFPFHTFWLHRIYARLPVVAVSLDDRTIAFVEHVLKDNAKAPSSTPHLFHSYAPRYM
jgi:hypothetical protein